jgi:hypothetical protein
VKLFYIQPVQATIEFNTSAKMIALAGLAMIIFKASPEATLKGSIMTIMIAIKITQAHFVQAATVAMIDA